MQAIATVFAAIMMLPAAGYMFLLVYSHIIGAIEHKAAFFGMFAVIIGIMTIAGLGYARLFFSMWRRDQSPLLLIGAACFLTLAALGFIMQRLGHLDEQFVGPFIGYSNLGYTLGVIAGAGVFFHLIAADREVSSQPPPERRQ